MPLSKPADWGRDEPTENEKSNKEQVPCKDCMDCDAYREAMTDLGKIILPVEKGA